MELEVDNCPRFEENVEYDLEVRGSRVELEA
jgi:hypothetical protein